MKKLLEYLLSEILGNNDFEIVETTQESGFVNIKIVVDSEYMGILIGKKGKMIKSLRTLLKAKATLDRVAFSLDIEEKTK